MKSPEQKIADIRKPPSLANWVRLNERRRDTTASKIFKFAIAKPRHALVQVYDLVADYVTLRVSAQDIRKGVDRILNPLVRKLGHEIITALLPWLDEQGLEGIQVYHNFNAPYPIGRNVVVPVRPTFVCLHDGVLTPVFVIGWSSFPFSDFHKRLFCAIVRRAILSQEDFEGSDCLIIFVPRHKGSKSERYVRSFWVSSIRDMSEEELHNQLERFGDGLDDAVPLILAELARRGE